ncbi:MAG: WbqC family protein [bacterium]|nr:MAG: WbqC family protein [bacterium]
MILATHQPIFLPWQGFFFKAAHADYMVLLDDVQYPRGKSWMNRNRLKNKTGTLWLTVPVWKAGRGLQSIRNVEICDERGWRRKHLRSIQHNYANAPYFDEYFPAIESIYQNDHKLLADFNIELIRYLLKALGLRVKLLRQSDLGIEGGGTQLLITICERVGADRLLIFPVTEKYLDRTDFDRHGIEIVTASVQPPVYPQLWGAFIYNLSIVDMLLNCGPACRSILARA